LRFLLIVPVLVLFAHGLGGAALAAYVTLGLTDIADGVVARRRREQTEFGVVMDPLGDVFSTAAIFSLFLARGLVPLWVFALLMARYTMLIAGSFALFLATGPIRFRATIPGKVVGLVQGAGVVVITVCAMADRDWLDAVGPVVFPVLGAGFASIVVSQAVIGLRHIRSTGTRRKAVEVES
jgi:cardiolipin synthase